MFNLILFELYFINLLLIIIVLIVILSFKYVCNVFLEYDDIYYILNIKIDFIKSILEYESMDNSERDRAFKQRERRRIEFQKQADANVTIKNGKRVINTVAVKGKVKQGQQTHGRSNQAGAGLNPQQRKTKEDRKLKNVQDITNENDLLLQLVR